jgi:thiol-disulfide isomerase/thioredoxin
MARTYTKEIPLGYLAPDFNLLNVVDGSSVSFEKIKGEKGTLVMFICNHCPFVIHVRQQLVQLANDYLSKGIGFVAISSNDVVNYPDDSPEKMKELALELRFPFPYLYDETQEVALAYDAACTPDFSVFDENNFCIYRGQLDDARPSNDAPNDGKDLRKVFGYILANKLIDFEQKPSLGCNIKWKNQ